MTAREILKTYYGYDSFRPLQEEIICHAVGGGDALVLMPTGGGKSLCYQIPALMLEGTAVVVSPLISLMKDQVDALRSNGISAEALNSSNDSVTDAEIYQRICRGEVKILYLSPERLVGELEWLRQNVRVSLIAIDEAHCISQWGHDFRPEYTQLGCLGDAFPSAPVLALTATADKTTRLDILKQLSLREQRVVMSGCDRPTLSLDVRRSYTSKDRLGVIKDTILRHRGESGIIYCLSRKATQQLAEKLSECGFSVGVYHAGMTALQRTRVQEDFINDRINVICATISFGMGIDKSNVRFVIHNNLPKSIESFYQEIGRGGRDGLGTETILFYNLQDLITLKKFAEESGQKEINLEKLKRMEEYAEASVCRRRILLNYFGETSDCQCGNCDVCKNPPQRFDGTVVIQKALSAIRRTNQQIGLWTTVDILRGNTNASIMSKGYNSLRTFGAGRDIPAREWHDYLLQMLQMGYIEIAYNEDMHLKVTSLGDDVLYGRKRAELAVIVHEDRRKSRKKVVQPVLFNLAQGEDAVLFEKLRVLRRAIADEIGKPAYIVLSDKTLHALAQSRPTTLDDFGEVSGIGQYKKETLGERFTALIREHVFS